MEKNWAGVKPQSSAPKTTFLQISTVPIHNYAAFYGILLNHIKNMGKKAIVFTSFGIIKHIQVFNYVTNATYLTLVFSLPVLVWSVKTWQKGNVIDPICRPITKGMVCEKEPDIRNTAIFFVSGRKRKINELFSTIVKKKKLIKKLQELEQS